MLCLTRNAGSSIYITLEDGRVITVDFISILGGQAKVGIEAPKTIAIHRDNCVSREQKAKA